LTKGRMEQFSDWLAVSYAPAKVAAILQSIPDIVDHNELVRAVKKDFFKINTAAEIRRICASLERDRLFTSIHRGKMPYILLFLNRYAAFLDELQMEEEPGPAVVAPAAEPEQEPEHQRSMRLASSDSITLLRLSVRSYNRLRRHGVDTIAQFLALQEDDLRQLPQLGEKSVAEILEKQRTYREAQSSKAMDSPAFPESVKSIVRLALRSGDPTELDQYPLTEGDSTKLNEYKRALDLVGFDFAKQVVQSPNRVKPIMEMLVECASTMCWNPRLQHAFAKIPKQRRPNAPRHYAQAVLACVEVTRIKQAWAKSSRLATLLEAAPTIDDLPALFTQVAQEQEECCALLEQMLDFLALDYVQMVSRAMLAAFTNAKVENGNVLRQRVNGQTLVELANRHGLTRERIRQREVKMLHALEVQFNKLPFCPLAIVHAECGGEVPLTEDRVLEYYGKLEDRDVLLYYFISASKAEGPQEYQYDKDRKAFVKNADAPGRVPYKNGERVACRAEPEKTPSTAPRSDLGNDPFYQWMLQEGCKPRTAYTYANGVRTLSQKANEWGLTSESLLELAQPDELIDTITADTRFININTKGHYMYSAALQKYMEFIESGQPRPAASAQKHAQPDPALVEALRPILFQLYGKNGIQPTSYLAMARLLRALEAANIALSDNDVITAAIREIGVPHGDKVYFFTAQAIDWLRRIAQAALKKCPFLYYDAFMAQHEAALHEYGIYDAQILRILLERELPMLQYRDAFACQGDPRNLSAFLLSKCKEYDSLTVKQLHELFPYIPEEVIRKELRGCGEMMRIAPDTFMLLEYIQIQEDKKERQLETIRRDIALHHQFLLDELDVASLLQDNPTLSEKTVREAFYRLHLAHSYYRHGAVLTNLGLARRPAREGLEAFCKQCDRTTFKELCALEDELKGKQDHWHPLAFELGYRYLVRINETEFVSPVHIAFDIKAIDAQLDKLCQGDYMPLRSATLWAAFPWPGVPWNQWLLESFVRSYSQQFRFDVRSFNSTNTGAIVRKTCPLTYSEIMIDAIANAPIALHEKEAIDFLAECGYINRRRIDNISLFLEEARRLREGGRSIV